jgi:uncharacterized protein (TIGR00251 family)
VAAVVIRVKVKPGARVSRLEPVPDGIWLAQLKAPPVDGKANEELVGLVASHFACRRSVVSIKSGAASRLKLVQVDGAGIQPPVDPARSGTR